MAPVLVVVVVALTTRLVGAYYHETVGVPAATALYLQELSAAQCQAAPSFQSEQPYFAALLIALESGQTSVCGAALVNERRLLTAAHCWWDGVLQARALTAVLGSGALYRGGTRLATSDVRLHDDYDPVTLRGDVAVAVVPRVHTSPLIQPIALPPPSLINATLHGWRGQVTGFGRNADYTGVPALRTLNEVPVLLASGRRCTRVSGASAEDALCSTSASARGPCGADSGGPLTVRHGGRDVLVGVVTWAWARDCVSHEPAGYTRVSNYLPWLLDQL
ncbi:collagenase-like [Battus philenor]|uniref:collagenase-like n=1 Tax=Battus philenor TaxID=42288 RepID=UPI0035CF7B5F